MKYKKVNTVHREDLAVSPVIGSVIMIFLIVLVSGVTVATLHYDDSGVMSTSLTASPVVNIGVKHAEGGSAHLISYARNRIVIEHIGGESLDTGSTSIVILGRGRSNIGIVPHTYRVDGDVVVKYRNLAPDGKLSKYGSRNEALNDGFFSTGEYLILCGDDSINGTDASSVIVTVDGNTQTRNNYAFKEGSYITLQIIDTNTGRIIAEDTSVVDPLR